MVSVSDVPALTMCWPLLKGTVIFVPWISASAKLRCSQASKTKESCHRLPDANAGEEQTAAATGLGSQRHGSTSAAFVGAWPSSSCSGITEQLELQQSLQLVTVEQSAAAVHQPVPRVSEGVAGSKGPSLTPSKNAEARKSAFSRKPGSPPRPFVR